MATRGAALAPIAGVALLGSGPRARRHARAEGARAGRDEVLERALAWVRTGR